MSSARSIFTLVLGSFLCLTVCGAARAQDAGAPPAYLAVVEGAATIERDGDVQPAVRDMPFVTGDRLRTEAGRVEIDFPDGTAIEVGAYSEVEALSPTRVRLLAGTMDHLQRRPVRTDSAAYLPQDLQRYGQTFDQYGSWNYDTSYGYVWYPRTAPDWRPYYYGSWSTVPVYGWTWVGLDAWSWPTHHYGRWGHARDAWFWIPGRTWSAAWVSWGLSADYVSWCPLGFDGRPVFALSIGLGGRGWNGWTVMSKRHFGYRDRYAHNFAVDPRHFNERTPFVQTARLPLTLGHGRDRARLRGDNREPLADRRTGEVPKSTIVAPPASAGVAVPRGAVSNQRGTPSAEPRRWNVDPRIGNAEPRTRNTGPRTVNPDPRTPIAEPRIPNAEPPTRNRFDRGVPAAAPRVYQPVVPPTAAPVVPPTAPAKITPEYQPPASQYRPPPPAYRPPTAGYRPPTYEARPRANDAPERTRAPERGAPHERAGAPAPQAAPRGSAAPSGKPESSGAKRPR
jgi:hypothetical protein